ncbi:MAG TPA: hypothetical protein VH372_14920 [Actinospica sp.]|nr:hypothetical protein [Actinospica sp.]
MQLENTFKVPVPVEEAWRVTGRPAQFGRGVVAEVSESLIGQFAENLARELENGQRPESGPARSAPAPQARPATGGHAADGGSLGLLGLAGGPLLKRLAPVLAVLAALAGLGLVRRARRGRAG